MRIIKDNKIKKKNLNININKIKIFFQKKKIISQYKIKI